MAGARQKRGLQLDEVIQKMKRSKPPDEPAKVVGGCLLCLRAFDSDRSLLLHLMGHFPGICYLGDTRRSEAHVAVPAAGHSSAANLSAGVELLVDAGMRSSIGLSDGADAPTMVTTAGDGKKAASSDLPYFMCAECSSTFVDSDSYGEHMDVHMRARRRPPTRADVAAVDEPAPRSHFRCIDCNASFADVNRYREHLKTHGIGERLFHCAVCSVPFPTRFELNRHMGSHTGGTNECDECGRCYRSRKALLEHVKSHRRVSVPAVVDSTRRPVDITAAEADSSTQNERASRNSSPRTTQPTAAEEIASAQPSTAQYPKYAPVRHNLSNDYLNNLLDNVCRQAARKPRRLNDNLSILATDDGKVVDELPLDASEQLNGQDAAVRVQEQASDAKSLCSDAEPPLIVNPFNTDYFKDLIESNVRKYFRQRLRESGAAVVDNPE